MKQHKFNCSVCKKDIIHESDFTTGYSRNDKDEKICFSCCAEMDKKEMKEKGKIYLYLSEENKTYSITNWPGTLQIKPIHTKKGYHNIASERIDTWFKFDGFIWHGVNYGYNSQILHCKKTKRTNF